MRLVSTGKKSKIIYSESEELIFLQLRNELSVPNKNYEMLKRRGYFASPRSYYISKNGSFETLLTPEIVKICKEKLSINVDIDEKIDKKIHPSINIDIEDVLSLKARYYQLDAAKMMSKCGRGILNMGTGAGKTANIALFFENLYKKDKNFKCLFIVPSLILLEQLKNDFVDYNVSFSFNSIQNSISENFIVANRQQISSKNFDSSIIKQFNYIIFDEVHLAANEDSKFVNIIHKNSNTDNIFGLTGTVPQDREKYLDLISSIGPVIYEKSSYELRNEGFVSNVKVLRFDIIHTKKPTYIFNTSDTSSMYRDEQSFIANSNERNNFIVKLVKGIKEKNILILADTIEQSDLLYNNISKIENKQVFKIQGSSSEEYRENAKNHMENNDNTVIIATTSIFAQGVSIKRMHYVMMASFSKSFETIVQSIGRSLRLHESKSIAYFVDLNDINLKYAGEFAKKRLDIYEKERIEVIKRDLTI